MDGNILPRLQTDLTDLKIWLFHERRNAAPLMAENLSALQIYDLHVLSPPLRNSAPFLFDRLCLSPTITLSPA
jgi:hypothetical protein